MCVWVGGCVCVWVWVWVCVCVRVYMGVRVGVGVGVGVRLCVSNVVYMGVGGALIDMLTLETR